MLDTSAPHLIGILALARKTLGEDARVLRLELQQVGSLLTEAVSTLDDAFRGLASQTDAQRALIQSLLGGEGGHGVSLATLEREVRALFRRLSQDLEAGAELERQSSKRMDALVKRIEGTFSLLSKLDEIVSQSHILSINAHIEAARSGERGKAFGVVATEVRGLAKVSRELSHSMADNVHEVRRVIVDVRSTVEETSTRGAAAATDADERLFDQLAAFDLRMSETLTALHAHAARIESLVGAAIRALQFEDMTRQLLECCQKRITRIESVLASVDAALSAGPGGLTRCNDDIEAAAAIQIWSPVMQDSLTHGSAELF